MDLITDNDVRTAQDAGVLYARIQRQWREQTLRPMIEDFQERLGRRLEELSTLPDEPRLQACQVLLDRREEWLPLLHSDEPQVKLDLTEYAEDAAAGQGGDMMLHLLLTLVAVSHRSAYWDRDVGNEQTDGYRWVAVLERPRRQVPLPATAKTLDASEQRGSLQPDYKPERGETFSTTPGMTPEEITRALGNEEPK